MTNQLTDDKFYPNRFARIIISALEEVMGTNGLHAVLRLAKLEKYIAERPPNNLEKEFPFSEFTALQAALEEMYGPRGGRGLAIRAGRATFENGAKGVLHASQISVGEENNLNIRVYGTKGGFQWFQQEPNSIHYPMAGFWERHPYPLSR